MDSVFPELLFDICHLTFDGKVIEQQTAQCYVSDFVSVIKRTETAAKHDANVKTA